ncbi:MAG TPA: adenylate/guanylate cyclase domain-containing protein [Burkholderiales bacterium]|nr:adenylate/guanylate cyclase domain-containing protein [Burkholderiales bacterium]
MTTKRKLTAILSADVFGYSRLMADDEPATLATLNEFRRLIQEHVIARGGRVVDSTGDAILAEFTSAVEAIACGLEVQLELAERNSTLAEHRRMLFRFGINLGDVIEEEGALYGDGVNIAARLQSLAEPGSICVSGAVREAVEGKLEAQFQDMGEQRVKNIPRPVRTYRVSSGKEALSSTRPGFYQHRNRWILSGSALIVILVAVALAVQFREFFMEASTITLDPALAIPTGPAIAVLAFENLSGDPNQDYFGEGISEEIISGLSRFRNLRVLARNSTFQFKGQARDVREIGKEIGADYVVEGSVRRAGDIVRVTAQLLDAKNGAHVWAETYDRQLDPENLFSVQDEITNQVVARIGDIHGAVNRADMQKVRAKSKATLEDYDCVLKTYEYQRFLTPDKHAVVKTCLTQTVQRNPGYADAWANLAYAYVDQYWAVFDGPPDPLDWAYAAARKAVELDPASQWAHFSLANVHFFRKEWNRFFQEADKALELNPNNTEVVASLAVRLVYAGKRDRGLALMNKAMSLNPSHPGWYWIPIVYDHYWDRDYEKALEAAIRIDMPGFWYANVALAMNYGQLGRRNLAKAQLDELRRLNPGFEKNPYRFLDMWFLAEHSDHVVEGLRKAGLALPSRQDLRQL